MSENFTNIEQLKAELLDTKKENWDAVVKGSNLIFPFIPNNTKALRKEDIPELAGRDDVTNRLIKFIVSSSIQDRMKDIIQVEGIRTENYEKNPIILFAHDSHNLPIGRSVLIKKEFLDNSLKLTSVGEFLRKNEYEFADVVYRMVKRGFLNAVSIGFVPLKFKIDRIEQEEEGVFDQTFPFNFRLVFLEIDMLEYSVVPTPANPEALVVDKNFSKNEKRKFLEYALDNWQKFAGDLIIPKNRVEKAFSKISGKSVVITKEQQKELLQKNLENILRSRIKNEGEEFPPYIIHENHALNTETDELIEFKKGDEFIKENVVKIIKEHEQYLLDNCTKDEAIESIVKLSGLLGVELEEKMTEEVENVEEVVEIEKAADGETETVSPAPELEAVEEAAIEKDIDEHDEKNVDMQNDEEIEDDSELVEKDSDEATETKEIEEPQQPAREELYAEDNDKKEIAETTTQNKNHNKVVIKEGDKVIELETNDPEVVKILISTLSSQRNETQPEQKAVEQSVEEKVEPAVEKNAEVEKDSEPEINVEELKSLVEEVLPEVVKEVLDLVKNQRKGNLDFLLGKGK